uniref:Small ribosomal subunit protein uS13c n=3 Tax=Sargassum TaxID=3015 RepID=A0A8K1RQD9_9PHAE|nr:30S ribosomal protein S13 [Sargassum confusum]QXI87587.1 ribosomal protein S13 [Sargassum muticum]UEP18081.1 ribosomal protein S13 [Sargassum kjellmanianum]UVW81625.1 30S ribosomal protein S13 [Sargassum siliquastrum]AZJ16082.1 30S ribosomal protein S13 [Sargassum confusum]UVF63263.1 30S ribosomal protein S13 [Sargassum confusum]
MVRLLGRDLANNKKIKYALTTIYGIGLSRSKEILEIAGLHNAEKKGIRVKDLSDEEISSLRKVLEKNYQLEGDLLRLTNLNIKRLMENGSIKGRRHRAGLPVRGQRTRTNARTRRGGKKTVAGKKK